MTKNYLFIVILSVVSLVFNSCEEENSYYISIDIPTEIADSMKCSNHKVIMSDHFDKKTKSTSKRIFGDNVKFKNIARSSTNNIIDITIGDYTLHLIPDTAKNIEIQFIDAYQYIVKEGSAETNFIALYNDYYYDIKRKLIKHKDNVKEQESICKTYKTYTDSILKRNCFTQWAYLHVAEQIGVITQYDFNNIDDRKILYRVTQAWKARSEESEQYKLLKQMTMPVPVDVRKTVPYSQQSTFIDLNLPDANGKLRSLKELEGKNVILLFCSARIMSEQELNRIKQYYTVNKDVEIYHVNFDKDEEEFRKFAKQYPWIMVNDPSFKSGITYQVKEIPTIYLFNKRGNIVGKNIDFVGFKF